MNLADNQRRHLKKLAHHLKPVVIVGQAGVTESLLAELDNALLGHELIKVKIAAGDRQSLKSAVERLCEGGDADLIQLIGHMAILFRANPEKKHSLKLPAPT